MGNKGLDKHKRVIHSAGKLPLGKPGGFRPGCPLRWLLSPVAGDFAPSLCLKFPLELIYMFLNPLDLFIVIKIFSVL